MGVDRIDLEPATPWVLRLFDSLPVAPVWTGLAIATVTFLGFLVCSAVFGEGFGYFAEMGEGAWLPQMIQALLVGFAPAVSVYSIRGSQRDLRDLGPALQLPRAELSSLRREIMTYSRPALWAAGIVAVLAAQWVVFYGPEIWRRGARPPLGDPALSWMVFLNAVVWWLIVRAALLELMLARAFSTLGDRLPSIDLLDRVPLAPFGRRALRSVLLWMLFMTLFSLMYVSNWASPSLGLGVGVVAAFALAAFLLPVGGAHRRLRRTKREELTRLHASIAQCRDRVLQEDAAEDLRGGRLADLVAYEARVGAAGEWPFDASTLLRFALYTGIGLGSWLGAALVERGLEAFLGR